MGIENSHIKEGAASALVPELLSLNVQPYLVLNICASQGKSLPSQRLDGWLNGPHYIRANLSEELSGDIPYAVLPDRWEGTFGAAHGMVDRKGNTVRAVGSESGWPLTIPDAQGIPESLFE